MHNCEQWCPWATISKTTTDCTPRLASVPQNWNPFTCLGTLEPCATSQSACKASKGPLNNTFRKLEVLFKGHSRVPEGFPSSLEHCATLCH